MATNRYKILFLCRKYYYLHKMSRVRFHAVEAIGKVCDVVWSGPEWENWNNNKSAQENIETLYGDKDLPDFVLCYRPEDIPGISEITVPSCENRDEMFTEEIPAEKVANNLRAQKIDLVISHQRKQLEHPLFQTLPCQFAYIPYCVKKSIFKDYGLEKTIDLLLVGNYAKSRYPLRHRLYEQILKMRTDPTLQNYHFGVYPYPGFRLEKAYTNDHVIHYAQQINAAKICVTCSGKYHLKYAKYVEVPACRSLLMADMPCEDQEILKNYLVEIDPEESYSKLVEKIVYYLENDEERVRLTDQGYQLIHNQFTQDHYAQQFIEIISQYLKEANGKKRWK